jgi:hypothetical protein
MSEQKSSYPNRQFFVKQWTGTLTRSYTVLIHFCCYSFFITKYLNTTVLPVTTLAQYTYISLYTSSTFQQQHAEAMQQVNLTRLPDDNTAVPKRVAEQGDEQSCIN